MAPWLGSLLTLLFTGLGQGLADRGLRMAGWIAALFAAALLVNTSPWFVYVLIAIKLACSADAYVLLAVDRGAAKTSRVLAAVSIAICIVGVLCLHLTQHVFEIPSSSMEPTLAIGDQAMVDTLLPSHGLRRGEVIVFHYPCEAGIDYVKRIVALGGDTVEVRCDVVYVNGKAIPRQPVPRACAYDELDDNTGWHTRTCTEYREDLDGTRYDVIHLPDATPHVHDFPSLTGLVPSCAAALAGGGDPAVNRQVIATPDRAHACAPQIHYVVPEGQVFVLGDNRDNSNDSRHWGGVAESAIIGRVTGIWLSHGQHGYSFGRVGRVH